jgi:Pyruvate:ferredoxin oxidoreductase and related 2-oxoacid:ferredoxin oxidoreductases, gamma subunit
MNISNSNLNILIVGVGGQGTILASKVLGEYAALENLDAKISEVHGMSQRGGSVVTHVRLGKDIASPTITEGEADYILSFERLEALRWSHYLKAGGAILINDQKILPMPVINGAAKYPEDIYGKLKAAGKNITIIDALSIGAAAGSTKTANVVMLGALFKLMNVTYEKAEKAVLSAAPQKALEVNKKALQIAYREKSL